jgi:hypothetical protein
MKVPRIGEGEVGSVGNHEKHERHEKRRMPVLDGRWAFLF